MEAACSSTGDETAGTSIPHFAAGDTVSLTVEGIGTLTNTVVARPTRCRWARRVQGGCGHAQSAAEPRRRSDRRIAATTGVSDARPVVTRLSHDSSPSGPAGKHTPWIRRSRPAQSSRRSPRGWATATRGTGRERIRNQRLRMTTRSCAADSTRRRTTAFVLPHSTAVSSGTLDGTCPHARAFLRPRSRALPQRHSDRREGPC